MGTLGRNGLKTRSEFDQPISVQCSPSVSPENTRRHLLSLIFNDNFWRSKMEPLRKNGLKKPFRN